MNKEALALLGLGPVKTERLALIAQYQEEDEAEAARRVQELADLRFELAGASADLEATRALVKAKNAEVARLIAQIYETNNHADRLIAEARNNFAAALELIRKAEWSGSYYGHPACPWCKGLEKEAFIMGNWHKPGHFVDCAAYRLVFRYA
jgi:hypothetical protein